MSAPARRTPVVAPLALVLLPLVALLLVPAGPASAHTALRSSTPAADEQLTTPPTQVELVFTDTVLALGTQVVLTGPAGELAAGEAAVDGDTVTASLPADLPGGAYEVAWRVTAEDGHPISGTYAFTYSPPAAAPAAPPTAPAPPTTDAPAPPDSTDSPTESSAGSTEQTAGTSDDEGGSTAMWVVVGVAVAAAVGGGGTALARRRQ